MPTVKTAIIERLFRERWNEATRTLSSPTVTLEDVSQAIRAYNALNVARPMSTRNPANFFKDFIRNIDSANANWPAYVLHCGFAARQVTGEGDCFRFVQLARDDVLPFPKSTFAMPTESTPRHQVESVSMPLASRRLGRNDEPWLVQVVARLRIVETHFSIYSRRPVRQVDLLQMSVKLQKTEIDALFLLIEQDESDRTREVMVTCEAKRGRDDILEGQILQQAKAAFSMMHIDQDTVVPIAVRCLAPSTIHVVEFAELRRESYREVESLSVASDSVFEITPHVPGICD